MVKLLLQMVYFGGEGSILYQGIVVVGPGVLQLDFQLFSSFTAPPQVHDIALLDLQLVLHSPEVHCGICVGLEVVVLLVAHFKELLLQASLLFLERCLTSLIALLKSHLLLLPLLPLGGGLSGCSTG